MQYEEIPHRDFEEIFELILEARGEDFSTLLRSAALHASPEDFGRLLDRAADLAISDLDGWAVAEAVSMAAQFRSLVPVNVDEVLQRLCCRGCPTGLMRPQANKRQVNSLQPPGEAITHSPKVPIGLGL
jgi:hypothetical protein